MILGAVQPSYLSWLPLFARILVSDVFVHLDDVEYSKNSFHNRNRIYSPQGPLLLTVPVQYSGSSKSYISEIEIDYRRNWQEKHLKSIVQNYRKAPYFYLLEDFLIDMYSKSWATLADLNVHFIDYMAEFLGIQTPRYRSSQLDCNLRANDKLIQICKKLNADHFIVKPGTEDYHPSEVFLKEGIQFHYFNFSPLPYEQPGMEFYPYLSVLDFAVFCGPNSSGDLKKMIPSSL